MSCWDNLKGKKAEARECIMLLHNLQASLVDGTEIFADDVPRPLPSVWRIETAWASRGDMNASRRIYRDSVSGIWKYMRLDFTANEGSIVKLSKIPFEIDQLIPPIASGSCDRQSIALLQSTISASCEYLSKYVIGQCR